MPEMFLLDDSLSSRCEKSYKNAITGTLPLVGQFGTYGVAPKTNMCTDLKPWRYIMIKSKMIVLALTGLLSTAAIAATSSSSTGPTDPVDNAPRTPASMENGTKTDSTGNMGKQSMDNDTNAMKGTKSGTGAGTTNGGGMSNGSGMGGSGGGGAGAGAGGTK
ncbi:MAG: hypothetical protein ACOH2R_27310 [Pseudomonas sp.]